MHKVKPQTELQLRRAVGRKIRRPVSDVLRVKQFRYELSVLVYPQRHPDVREKLVGEVQDLDAAFTRVCSVNVSDILIESEALSTALLSQHQDWSKLEFAACASARARRIGGRDRYLQIATERHAEPMVIWIYQAELCSYEEIA